MPRARRRPRPPRPTSGRSGASPAGTTPWRSCAGPSLERGHERGRGRGGARAAAPRALPRRRRLRRALRPQPPGAPGPRAASRIRQGLRAARRGPRRRPRPGSPGRSREVDERAVARRRWPAATGGSTPRVEPARRLRRLWAFLLRRGLRRPASCATACAALWPRWSDALDGLEPSEPAEARQPGRRAPGRRLVKTADEIRSAFLRYFEERGPPRGEELAARARRTTPRCSSPTPG